MINLGVYMNSLGDPTLSKDIFTEIGRGLNENLIEDASIFYDQIGHLEDPAPCGLFHSSDLWNFEGHLLILSISSALRIVNIANHIQIILGYGWGQKNTLATLKILEDKKVNTICHSESLANDFYRISGRQAIGYSPNFKNTINMITDQYNDK